MQTKTLFALAAAVAGAAAQTTSTVTSFSNATTTITTVVAEFTTYCPEPTVLTYNEVCYTVTEPTHLVVTDCPCTIVTEVPIEPTPAPPAGTGAWTVPVVPSPSATYVVVAGAPAVKNMLGAAVAVGAAAIGAAVL